MSKWRALLLLVVWALVLTGCGSSSEPVAEPVPEQQFGEETNADLEQDGGEGSQEEIPADFPGEFPLPDGELYSAIKVDDSWQLTYVVSDQESIAELAEWFPSNGFTNELETDFGGVMQWIFDNERYMVTLGLILSEDGHTFSYLVSIK